jgi:predicted nucleotidyltransferase
MAQTTSRLEDIIQRYSRELERLGIRCQQILVFGSTAKGTASEGSDIDLVVISPDWAPYNERERLEMLGITAARILEPIQAYGMTMEEMATYPASSFWRSILDEATLVVV